MDKTWQKMYREAVDNAGVIRGRTVSEQQLLRRRALNSGITKLHTNIYVLDDQWRDATYEARVRGLIRAVEEQALPKRKVYCLETAATLWGLDVPYRLQEQNVLHLVGARNSRSEHPLYHFVNISSPRIVQRGGIDVTDLPQTLRDCSHHLPFADALAIIESAMRTNALADHLPELRKLLRTDATFRGVYSHATWHSESVGESIAKAAIIDLGFQSPLQQVEFSDQAGNSQHDHQRPTPKDTYRVDFLWMGEDGYIVGEFDGVGKYYTGGEDIHSQVSRTIDRERARDTHLYQLGAKRVVHFDYRMVMNRPAFQQLLLKAGVPRAR